MMTEERRQFEAWTKMFGAQPDLTKANGGANYSDSIIDIAWLAWKASRAAQPASHNASELTELLEGMEVSVDVSTGDHDAGNRYFGTVTEVVEHETGKNGLILLVQDAEPNFTQPASPALRLPDPFDANDAKMFCAAHGVTGAYELASQMANYAVDKVVRLNAPHTAPIEPICATGGAEWVKCCDGKPDIDVTVWCYGQYDDGSDDTDNYAFPGYMDKKGRWFACNNGDYVDGGYGNDYRACVARWMSLPAAPEE